jgi:carbamoyl-phosphate synthase small subunit
MKIFACAYQRLNIIQAEAIEGSFFSNPTKKSIYLVLEDGETFEGFSFGHSPSTPVVGEVVFNTGMVGYPEALTDPSYCGQILCFTYPLIGNYGVPDYEADGNGILQHFESNRIQVSGLIASRISNEEEVSHFESRKTLDVWLRDEGVAGIERIDTRELTIHLREQGVMLGAIAASPSEGRHCLANATSYSMQNFFDKVTCRKARSFGVNKRGRIALIDCGVKLNIIRSLVRRGFEVTVFPYDAPHDSVMATKPDGVVLSNGPGDPKTCAPAIDLCSRLIDDSLPVLGICLGTQIVALSQGGDTFKLKYGHRGQNKPCLDLLSGRCLVTSQNHGYSVDPDSIEGTGLRVWFLNADDKTVEGLIHENKPCLSVQFHPEASPGPVDASYVFDVFSEKVVHGERN